MNIQITCKFELPLITQDKVNNYLKSMPSHKATGSDGLSIKLLKIAASAISPSICKLMNHCISKNEFPSQWKIARVTPIFKNQGQKDDKSNYRPISVLPILSKVYEKHIHESLYEYCNKNNILHNLQSGFRKGYSTESALIRIIDQMLFDLDSNKISGLVFVDYKKAFDLIDHEILLAKLKEYGLESSEVQLFKNYLSNRKQYVQIDGNKSSLKLITNGVPQGSILGPLLFSDIH